MSVASSLPPPISREPFAHPALFYRGLREYLRATVAFIEDGLAAEEPVAVAVPGAKLDPLRAELGEAAERVRFLDMGEVGANPGRIIPGVLLAFADAHRRAERVRIIGEPIWPGRTDIEYPACVQHEALINLAFAGRNVTILCPYDAQRLPGSVLADAETTHPTLIDSRGSRRSVTYSADRALSEFNRPLPPPAQPQTLCAIGSVDLSAVRRLAVAQARHAGLSPDRITDFELVINELVTNSIEHGGGTAELRLWLEDGHLVAEVSDTGTLVDPLVGRRPAGPGQLGGRGLLLVNQLVDLVRVHNADHATTIRIYLRRR